MDCVSARLVLMFGRDFITVYFLSFSRSARLIDCDMSPCRLSKALSGDGPSLIEVSARNLAVRNLVGYRTPRGYVTASR